MTLKRRLAQWLHCCLYRRPSRAKSADQPLLASTIEERRVEIEREIRRLDREADILLQRRSRGL